MLGIIMYICEVKKELLVGLSLSILYITYYLVEVVKKPILVCRAGEFRQFLEESVPLVRERYWPTPWCVEARLQTVVGSLLRSYLLPAVRFRREILRLSDGGQVALDWVEESEPEPERQRQRAEAYRAVVVVLPGLTGGSHADYVRCVAAAASALPARCVVFNQRGLGGVPLTSPRLYCAVSHPDLAEVVAAVRSRVPGAPVVACGVSLGGLILGQYLAAAGGAAGVAAALVVSSPLDVERGAECMERAPLNALLSWHMARNLRNTVRAHEPLAAHWERPLRGVRSVRQFDAAFTTEHFGFRSVDAYYRAATLRDKLHLVRVPLLCLCAADDPFQPLDVMPVREVEACSSGLVGLVVPARGGHIGFLEGWWCRRASDQYLARLVHQYFDQILRRPDLLHRPPKPKPKPDHSR